jgi:hypothetical protein
MRRRYVGWLAGALLLAGLLVVSRSLIPAAESPLAANWKLTVLEPGQEVSPFLVQLRETGGKWEAKVLSSPLMGEAKITRLQVGDDRTVELAIEAGGQAATFRVRPPAGDTKPQKLRGSVAIRGRRQFAELQRTDARELRKKEAMGTEGTEIDDLNRALRNDDPKERTAALKQLVEQNPDSLSLVYAARSWLLRSLAAGDAAPADLRAAAEQLVKTVPADHGPEMKAAAELAAARALLARAPQEALEYARQADKVSAKGDLSREEQVAVLKVLASALPKADPKGEDLKDVTARLARAEEEQDKEFENGAIPFKPEPYGGRKGTGDRVVLVELFTGSECPPCVAADVAFDAALQTYKPTDVAFLEYHLHVPGPDPMANKDTEARAEYYRTGGTPTAFIDGKKGPHLGGPRQEVKDSDSGEKFGGRVSYDRLTDRINDALEEKSEGRLELKAERSGDTVTIRATASKVSKFAKGVRLRLALVEEVVRYPGGNGQRLHHHVVRALPGGVKGVAVEDGSASQEVKVDLAGLRKALAAYLKDFEKENGEFSDESRPLNLEHLKVVAWLQDDDNKQVLQAAQVDVPAAK